jgi:hypothetical protein
MTFAAKGDERLLPREMKWTTVASCLVFVSLICLRFALQYKQVGTLYLEDDAYYYTVIAQNIAHHGLSTFDGQTLTNGYHPLWLVLLVVQDLTIGASPYATVLIELLLVTAGLWLFLASFRTRAVLFQIIFAVSFALLAWPMIMKGMEVSLLIFALGLFTKIAVARWEGPGSAVAFGLAAVLCIGARIDAAVFVLPTMIFASGSLRRTLPALVPVVLVGALYAGVNLYVFGLPFPISGSIKSLGGLQLNRALLDQAAAYWHGPGTLRDTIAFLKSFIGRPLVIFAMTLLALAATKQDCKSRPLCLGYLVGFLLFALKLTAFSSWAVWPWYAFSALIGLSVIFHVLDDLLARNPPQLDSRVEIAATLLVLLVAVVVLRDGATRAEQSFEPVNLEAVSTFGPVFKGARVAMGDRAGSFAAHYAGPVTQLEGLVNDRAYLQAIEHHADIRPLLCRRGVRFVLSYQKDLGGYQTATVSALKHSLTHYPSPTLTFSRADEVGRVSDLSHYENSSQQDDGDDYLYAWRLSGCDTADASVSP